jgi:hypothetical protein
MSGGIKMDLNKMPLQTVPYTYWKNLYERCFTFHSNNKSDREYLHVLKAMWEMSEWFQMPGKNFPVVPEITYDYIIYDVGESPQDQMIEVMMKGAVKYAPCNWCKTMNWSRLVAAYLRHGLAIYKKQRFDPETGLFHAAHMLANYTMLQAYVENRLPTDDRPFITTEEEKLNTLESTFNKGFEEGHEYAIKVISTGLNRYEKIEDTKLSCTECNPETCGCNEVEETEETPEQGEST